MSGGLLVAGTASDAGKSLVTAGICRWLKRRGVSVAPFKAQNMALNSAVTPGGAEIGRAQAMQAAAAGVAPEAAMNPVLIKPSGASHSQVLLMGKPHADATARSYQELKHDLREGVAAALADLRSRYDVVICEGAGSPAEINLRAGDLANMGLARAANLPVVVVGDIDRGGVFASLYGTLALLEPADQALISGFLINKFRGDATILQPGIDDFTRLTGRPTLGVLPWQEGLWLDVEDSLALEAPRPEPLAARGRDTLEVAVVRLRWMSNFTDVDALAAEPGVSVRFTRSVTDIERADLVLLPGTKATVEDLERLRASGLADALVRRANQGEPILGVCGGYQMLGGRIEDEVESRRGGVDGLGVLPVTTVFEREKLLRKVRGRFGDVGGWVPAHGYEIRHGRPVRSGASALLDDGTADGEGCRAGNVLGTSWHGLLEGDDVRRALLRWVAAERGRDWTPGIEPFAAVRERHLDRLGDLVEEHADTDALMALIERGAPTDLPVLAPGGASCSCS
ncbi:MAG TPA: cobyric acid synthase [Solirubrobacteraceae bacterium]|nr:cobyric acid synthase [Solirubrobacteraceae bacterium]